MIAIIDYGMANLRSVERALHYVGGDPIITSDPKVIAEAEKVVLPGVGAFTACMVNLQARGLQKTAFDVVQSGRPFLGICVGLQMLFETSSEMGTSSGLGIVKGHVRRFFEGESEPDPDYKVPHIGWNTLKKTRDSQLLHGVEDGERVYFVHSYYPDPEDKGVSIADSEYPESFCCAVEIGNIAATQFHPEKSGAVGLQILRNFVHWST